MANKYTLRYLPVAVDDLISIFDWIANDSPANAAAFIEKLDQRIGVEIHRVVHGSRNLDNII